MGNEEFYGDKYKDLIRAQRNFGLRLQDLKEDNPEHIMYISTRLKSADSAAEKLKKLDIPKEHMYEMIYDLIGYRIVCPFVSDIYLIAEMIREFYDITVVKEKDYLKHPKESGYQSYHILVRLQKGIKAEIQIRTIALDFWASLEHKLKYKKHPKKEQLLTEELKRVAGNIAALDVDMETLRQMIEEEE